MRKDLILSLNCSSFSSSFIPPKEKVGARLSLSLFLTPPPLFPPLTTSQVSFLPFDPSTSSTFSLSLSLISAFIHLFPRNLTLSFSIKNWSINWYFIQRSTFNFVWTINQVNFYIHSDSEFKFFPSFPHNRFVQLSCFKPVTQTSELVLELVNYRVFRTETLEAPDGWKRSRRWYFMPKDVPPWTDREKMF